ncbi:GNAT family N-acetyltransferase [Nocardioides zeae]|uniref:GNAT family N-acetyltransferase n=1 Tax=Nocardioides imazamoxiresistens TaxID=3231893 RepID=A0ABU3PQH1_9ACTN|nr:GNAT family N-acetyltransferase [Nocardioides zeae]MDT9591474.1 GNAT family N-acetyltransferase [Nocardioides zeae]
MIPGPTERLRFREMTDADLDRMAGLLGDPEVMRHYPAPKSRGEALGWIRWNQRSYAEHGHGLWIVETHDGAFVGDCGLTWQTVGDERLLEVGYHVVPAVQGRGYATEAARACLDVAIGSLATPRVVAIIRPGNGPSRRVAEKVGLRFERETEVRSLPVVLYGRGPAPGRLVLTCGVAGSGKTTYARSLEARGWLRFSIDVELWALAPGEQDAERVAAGVRSRQQEEIVRALRHGRDVVADYASWSRAERDAYRTLAASCGARAEVVHLDTPADEIRRRLALRRGAHADDVVVDGALLDRYLADFEAPGPDEPDVTVLRPQDVTAAATER